MSDQAKPDTPEQDNPPKTPPAPIHTRHQVKVAGKTLKYSAHTGMMPLRDDKGDHHANMFYTAYTLEGVSDSATRPLTFVFNGGPGSSSVWLHMGAVGPRRVKMHDEGWLPQPPYQLEDNPHTWLDQTDLVFIDPIGTGFSRALNPDDNSKFWSLKGDLDSVGAFIRLYLTRNKRWSSPLFMAGESYGTTRAAGLAGELINHGIAFNGILLISTIINFQTARFVRGNDLPYALFLPTYTATAWYHGRLPDDLQTQALPDVLAQVEAWTANEYTTALMQGDQLRAEQRQAIVSQLARFTGLDEQYIDGTKVRVNIMRFCKELLRDDNRTVGRLDSRFKGYADLAVTEFPEFDPSFSAIIPPYTAMFNQYVRDQLGYETDDPYEILSFTVNQKWEFDRGNFPDTSDQLRIALERNPYMQVYIGQGYYDLATPHFAAQYSMNHMGIAPELHDNLHYYFYEAGHMYYLDINQLARLKTDVNAFMRDALPD
ncbi:MAG: S10 family peptidase [Anaerolineae bacterium]